MPLIYNKRVLLACTYYILLCTARVVAAHNVTKQTRARAYKKKIVFFFCFSFIFAHHTNNARRVMKIRFANGNAASLCAAFLLRLDAPRYRSTRGKNHIRSVYNAFVVNGERRTRTKRDAWGRGGSTVEIVLILSLAQCIRIIGN